MSRRGEHTNFSQALATARSLEKKNEYVAAIHIYRELLSLNPSSKLVRKRLKAAEAAAGHIPAGPGEQEIGVILGLMNQGQLTGALSRALALSNRFPDYAPLANLLGILYGRLEHMPESMAQYERALSIKPDYLDVYNNLGNALVRLGRANEAIEVYRKALEIDQSYAIAYNGLGNALGVIGDNQASIDSFGRAIELNPDYAEAHNNLGNALSLAGRHEEALHHFARAIDINPRLVQAHANMGDSFRALARHQEAESSYRQALALRPDYAEACRGLGNVMNDQGLHREAIVHLRRALQLDPALASAHSDLGNALSDSGRHDLAVASYREAVRLEPDFAEVYSNLGTALAEFGDYEGAVSSCEKALEIRPDFAEAHNNLSRVKTFIEDDEQLATMTTLVEKPDLPKRDLMFLSFALGKAYDDLDRPELAFKYLEQGNRLRKEQVPYDIEDDKALFESIRAAFADPAVSALDISAEAPAAKSPIFIVGLPRSGTTLTEQVLASHSKVYGAGELQTMGRLLLPMVGSKGQGTRPPDESALRWIRSEYLNELEQLACDEPIVTDKMPANFRWIGHILLAMPEAKIVNLVRDPVACCWSMFRILFTGNGYTNDLLDLAAYYHLYRDLMAFWRNRFPGRIYDLDYQLLTREQEPQTRRLLECCGLDWEAQCLEFYKTERTVRTPSSKQVRRPMYTGSSESWRKYERWLRPMLSAIESAT